MVKADELKDQNVSEYIVHMFKSEDLVRTFKFDLNKITDYLIANIPVSTSKKKEQILWYASLIEQMREENIQDKGHLNELNNLINELTKLHISLIKEDKTYKEINLRAQPFIQNQVKIGENTITNPILICLNAIYGALLLKINGKTITEQQQKMLETFGDLLSYLSYTYN